MTSSPRARRRAPVRRKPAPRHAAARPEHSRVLPLTVASVVALSVAFTIATPALPRGAAILTATQSSFTSLSQAAPGAVTFKANARRATTGLDGPKRWATLTASSLQRVPGGSGDVTVRNVLTVTQAATRLRIRIGNPFGAKPLHLESVKVGLLVGDGTAALVPDTNERATFGGERSLEVPAGASVWSDPIRLQVAPRDQVAVSVYAPRSPVNQHVTSQAATRFTPGSFVSLIPGDVTGNRTGTKYAALRPGELWWVDAIAGYSTAQSTMVALGDSITDGLGVGQGARWTDILARRIARNLPDRPVAIANAGISGNMVSTAPDLYSANGVMCCGPPAAKRLNRDVLSLPGVTTVFLLGGTNDIGGSDVPPDIVIAAMQRIADRVHAAGKTIIAGTILPMCNPADSPVELARQQINAWIRESGAFDAVVDTDAALRDPMDPTSMLPQWRTDCWHPNARGGRHLARSIPLDLFAG